jgi:TonB family protein
MCLDIRTLANFTPPATTAEIRASARQFVRKVSGTNKPSKADEAHFNRAIDGGCGRRAPGARMGHERSAQGPGSRNPEAYRAVALAEVAGVVCFLVFCAAGCASKPAAANERNSSVPPSRGVRPVGVNCENIEAPKLIHRVEPAYPAKARQERLEGVVIMEAIITTEGVVSDVKVFRSPFETLTKHAVHAIRQWRYKPAFCRDLGKPIPVYLTVTMTFNLR